MGIFAGKVDNGAKVSSFDTFPADNYELELTEGSVEPTKKGDGEVFKHRIRVVSGEHEGRLIFGQINITNPKPQAQEIGQGEFLALRTVTDVLDKGDDLEPEDMFFKAFTGVVKIIPAKDGYEAKNAVNWGATYKLHKNGTQPDGGKAPVSANDNSKKPPAATGAGAGKPWGARKAAA